MLYQKQFLKKIVKQFITYLTMKNNNPYWFMLMILLFIGIPHILFSQSKGDIEKSGTFKKSKADIFVVAW